MIQTHKGTHLVPSDALRGIVEAMAAIQIRERSSKHRNGWVSGAVKRGIRVFTPQEVVNIGERVDKGESMAALAREHGVGPMTIKRVVGKLHAQNKSPPSQAPASSGSAAL